MKRSGMNVRLTDLLYLMVDLERLLQILRGNTAHGERTAAGDAGEIFQEGRM